MCDSAFPKKRGLEQHLQSGIHEQKRYRCDDCSKEFPSLASLSQHLNSTGHAARESRLLHVMVTDAQQTQRLMITDGAAPRLYFEATLFFDGSAQPNPGAGGCGVHLVDDRGRTIRQTGLHIAQFGVTSNQAEYHGLILGMQIAINEGVKRLKVKGDSELVIEQMKGYYQVQSERLISLYSKAKEVERHFQIIEFEHITRDENTVADSEAKAAV